MNLDANECLVENGGCEQRCVNKEGSYQCECNQGFQLQTDMRTCEGKHFI